MAQLLSDYQSRSRDKLAYKTADLLRSLLVKSMLKTASVLVISLIASLYKVCASDTPPIGM